MSKPDKTAHGTNDYLRVIAIIENEIGDSQIMLNQPEKALENLQKAHISLEKVIEVDNETATYKYDLGVIHRLLAQTYFKKGEKAKAVENVDNAIAVNQKLSESNSLKESDKNLIEELQKEKVEYSK